MIIFFLVLVAAVLIVVFVYLKTRNPKLSKKDVCFFREKIKIISNLSRDQQILEYDKLLDLALAKLGKKGTLGEKLKKSENFFSNINNVWKAHKVRNRIAHEVGFIFTDKEFKVLKKYYLEAFFDLKIK